MQAEDNRGAAVSEVQILRDGRARVHGRLQDGKRVEYTLGEGVGEEEELVGQVLEPPPPPADAPADAPAPTRKFVKAYLPDTDEFLLCNVNGFVTTYDTLPKAEAQRAFGIDSHADLPEISTRGRSLSLLSSSGAPPLQRRSHRQIDPSAAHAARPRVTVCRPRGRRRGVHRRLCVELGRDDGEHGFDDLLDA